MSTVGTTALEARFRERRPLVSSSAFGALILVFVETMLFSAFISAYFVIKKGRASWDLPSAIHIPAGAAGFNTIVLFLSGISLLLAGRAKTGQRDHLLRAIVLGAFFTVFQAYLGAKLVAEGLTMTSSIFGGCYFLMVGAHALNAALGVLALTKFYRGTKISFDQSAFKGLQVFWLFVVCIWPFLYAQIYF